MLRNMAICAALIVAGPAFGQVANLNTVPKISGDSANVSRSAGFADCQRH